MFYVGCAILPFLGAFQLFCVDYGFRGYMKFFALRRAWSLFLMLEILAFCFAGLYFFTR